MNILITIYCFIFGHDWRQSFDSDLERNPQYLAYKCQRCFKKKKWDFRTKPIRDNPLLKHNPWAAEIEVFDEKRAMKDQQPNEFQQNWKNLISRMGSEDAARKELARKLRLAADQVEKKTYPDVFGCYCENGELLANGFIEGITVVLSDPWSG